MSTTHHRTRIRAIRANSNTDTVHSTTGLPSTTRDRPYFMTAQPSLITPPCSSSSITTRLIEHYRC